MYVDDLIIAGSSKQDVTKIKKQIAARFKSKDLGTLKFWAGMEIKRDNDGILLNQAKYINDMLLKYDLQNTKPAKSPMATKTDLHTDTSVLCKNIPYRSLVGSLLWAGISTRPDIAETVNRISRFVANPNDTAYSIAKRAMRYLKSTSNLGIRTVAWGRNNIFCTTQNPD